METQVDKSFLLEHVDEEPTKGSVDFFNKSETLDDYLRFYASQHAYPAPIHDNLDPLQGNLNLEHATSCVKPHAHDFLQFDDINDDAFHKPMGSAPCSSNSSDENINTRQGDTLNFAKDFKLGLSVGGETADEITKEEDSSFPGNDEEMIFHSQGDFNSPTAEGQKWGPATSGELPNLSGNYPGEKSDLIHECALTNDFFETIENINTKVLEKYNNLKDVSERLIDVINRSDFEKRISNLLHLSDDNSELIDKFKKKSEDCIRKCRKFETTSENLIGECIDTLATSSICYGEWVCLHASEMDPIYKLVDDLQLFVQANR
ncbi:conserved Plasmodium protein, unknown function [Plasmodium ovale curtisi]|uniref:Uncharacterized protein n=1 Tax=Plasmodium ovale curtisi TaxID=864141 RepID=A0A1A8WNY9_PLAOA|nr:conserved Plasmodium protein, unknown function [Plasmodium ovale curtisi]